MATSTPSLSLVQCNAMQSEGRTTKSPYHPQDLASLVNNDGWSPTTMFPRPALLDKHTFPLKPQPYLDLIRRLSEKGHPDLKYLSNELLRQNGTLDSERSRAVVLEYSTTGTTIPSQQIPFVTSKNLETYLGDHSSTFCNRPYILEDISANFVEAFGSHFMVELSFWAQHLRTVEWETSKTAGIVSALPSVKSLTGSMSLLYPKYTIIDDTEKPRLQDVTGLYADCNVYRNVAMNLPGEFYNGVAKLNWRASIWTRDNSDGTWDGKRVLFLPRRRVFIIWKVNDLESLEHEQTISR